MIAAERGRADEREANALRSERSRTDDHLADMRGIYLIIMKACVYCV